MDNTLPRITYLNGTRFKRALIAGAKRVISRHDHLNKINVFPVSDSDTGTNISLTLSAGLKAVALEQSARLPDVLLAFADGTLESARGNSGTIFAQWFQGFCDTSGDLLKIDTQQFVRIFSAAADNAYKAVAEPVEGTMLTVLNDTAAYLNQLPTIATDFAVLFEVLVKKANESLQETPQKLKMLKKFGVVDAGAQAMVDFFEGILRFMTQGDIKGLAAEIAEIVENEMEYSSGHDEHEHNIDDYTYRFCTECVIVGDAISQDTLKEEIMGMGDSLVMAGSKRKTKIHMHVNQPAELFRICRRYGKLLNEKADDMFHQIKDAHAKHCDVAIVTDSAMDLPQETLDALNIHVIPIRIHVGDEAFIDRISITPEEFYTMVEQQHVLPKTAHPTYRDFKAKYQFLGSHFKSIISIHISKLMSNTLGAAELVQRDMAPALVTVIDSMTVSAGQGLLVQYAGELASSGMQHDDIVQRLKQAAQKIQIYAIVGNLEYAVKGGRLPAFVKRMADWFNIKPILDMAPGRKPKMGGVIRNKDQMVQKFADKVLAKMQRNKHYRVGVLHCETPTQGQELLNYLTQSGRLIDTIFLVNASVTIGSHAGPGTLGVAFMEMDKA